MTAETLQDALGDIREDYILDAHGGPAVRKNPWLRWGVLAACVCIIAAAVLAHGLWEHNPLAPVPDPAPNTGPDEPGSNTTIDLDPEPVGPQQDFTVTFNQVPDNGVDIDVGIGTEAKMAFCMFTEPLTEEERAAIVPDALPAEVEGAAAEYVGWPDGVLKWVYLPLVRPESGNRLDLYICPEGQQPIFDEIILPQDVRPTNIRGMTEVVFYQGGDTIWTSFPWGGVEYYLTASKIPEKLDDLKEDFYNLVVSLVMSTTSPDLGRLSFHQERHVFQERTLTLEEARLDPDFGAYLPAGEPEGLVRETIQRLQNSDHSINTLTAFWNSGYDYLTWSIRPMSEYDKRQIVAPEERERYDLTLYSIPLAESVPEKYRETVINPIFRSEELTEEMVRSRCVSGDGGEGRVAPSLDFSVAFGDIVVDITAKNVSPEWIYAQLAAMR